MTDHTNDHDDTAGERLVWALVAAIARDDDEAYELLAQETDEQTIRAALKSAINGVAGALARAAIAEDPRADLDLHLDHALAAVAKAASRKALEAAAND